MSQFKRLSFALLLKLRWWFVVLALVLMSSCASDIQPLIDSHKNLTETQSVLEFHIDKNPMLTDQEKVEEKAIWADVFRIASEVRAQYEKN